MQRLKRWCGSLKWLPHRIWRSLTNIVKFLYFKPHYMFLAFLTSVVFYEFIFWFLNLGLVQYLLTSPYLSFADKFRMIVGSYTGIFTQPFSSLAITLFVVSILQGVSVASLVYLLRRERTRGKNMVKSLGGSGVAGLFSILGLGCAACGTSLVTPILTFFFASSSVAMAETVGIYAAVVALIASVVTVYLTGLKLSTSLKS